MPYTYRLTPEPPTPLSDDLLQALSQLAERLADHYGQDTHCQLDLHLQPDLRVHHVLQNLQPPGSQPDLVEKIRRQIQSQVGDLSASQIERMVDSALHGVGIQIGIMLGSQSIPQPPRPRRMIHACPSCDEVFIDADSLLRHLQTHHDA